MAEMLVDAILMATELLASGKGMVAAHEILTRLYGERFAVEALEIVSRARLTATR